MENNENITVYRNNNSGNIIDKNSNNKVLLGYVNYSGSPTLLKNGVTKLSVPKGGDPRVIEFFKYDVTPRLKREDDLNKNQTSYVYNINNNIPVNYYYALKDDDKGRYDAYHEGSSGIFNNDNKVYLNLKNKLSRPTLVHEWTHGYRQGYLGKVYNSTPQYWGSGYNSKETKLLNNAYNTSGYNQRDYPMIYEKGTTNSEVRFLLWNELYNKLGRRPTLKETDNYIKGYNWNSLQEIIKKSNIYGNQMYKNGMNENNVKNTLIHVAQNDSQNDEGVDYARNGKKLLNKYFEGGTSASINVPDYFKLYGIDGDKFYGMYTALRDRGLEHPTAFYTAWQSIKERPRGYYSFGKGRENLDAWADSAYTSLTSGGYKNVGNVKDYNEFAKGAHKYNTENPSYWTKWLPEGMKDAEAYINSRGYTPSQIEMNSFSGLNMTLEPDKLKVENVPQIKVLKKGGKFLLKR